MQKSIFYCKAVFIKVIILFLAGLIVLTGCKSDNDYNRDDGEGKVLIISYDEAVNKMKNDEDFALLFTLIDCKYCEEMHEMLSTYLSNHNVTVYEVILDENFDSFEELNEGIKDFSVLKGVPSMFYVSNRRVIDDFKYSDDDNMIEKFDEWVQMYKLDMKG